MRLGSRGSWTLFSLWALAGCSFDPVDLEGRACPCATGWVCVDSQCVVAGDDAGRDAGEDIGQDSGEDAREDVGADTGEDAGRDAGTDSGPRDVGTDAPDAEPGSICDDSPAFFCSDFEAGGLVPPWTRSIVDGTGTVEITEVRALNGMRALRARSDGSMNRARMHYEFPVAHDATYARMHLYVPSASTHEFISVLLLGRDDSLVALQVRGDDTFSMFVSGGSAAVEPVTVPRDRWMCLSLSLVLEGGVAVYRATMDGTSIYEGPVMGSMATDSDFAMVGIENTGATSAEIFVDDVELATTPLPCGSD